MFSLTEPYTYNGYTFTPRLDDKSGNMKLYIKYPDSKLEFNKAFEIDEDRNFIRETASHGKLFDITYPYPHPLYKRMLDLMDGAREEAASIIQQMCSCTIIPAQPAFQLNNKGNPIYQSRFFTDDEIEDDQISVAAYFAKVIARESNQDIALRVRGQDIEIKHDTKLLVTDIIVLHDLKTQAQRVTEKTPPSRQTPDERLLVFITTLEETLDGSDPRTIVHALDQIHRLTLQGAVLTDVYTDLIPKLIVSSGYQAFPPALEVLTPMFGDVTPPNSSYRICLLPQQEQPPELTPLLEDDTPEPSLLSVKSQAQRLIQVCLQNAEVGGPGRLVFPNDFSPRMLLIRERIAAEGKHAGNIETSRINPRSRSS